MEAHAVSEDFRNHFKSAVSGDFKLKLTFFTKKAKHQIVLNSNHLVV